MRLVPIDHGIVADQGSFEPATTLQPQIRYVACAIRDQPKNRGHENISETSGSIPDLCYNSLAFANTFLFFANIFCFIQLLHIFFGS